MCLTTQPTGSGTGLSMPGLTSSCTGWRGSLVPVGSGVSEGKSVTEGVSVGVSVGVRLGVKVGVKVAGHGVVRSPTEESPPAPPVGVNPPIGVRVGRMPQGSSVMDGVKVNVELGEGDGVIVKVGVGLGPSVGILVSV